jgi:hypothetical protein
MNYRICFGALDDRIAITPRCENASRDEDASGLAIKAVEVEPMKCLSYRDQISRARGKSAAFGGG